MTAQDAIFAAIGLSALVPALLLHEVAHGWAAWKCGDPTAKEAGRLSLNPLKHVDPFMSILLPAILALSGSRVLFGGAKPVPIDLRRCRNPRRAYWMIAVAGPVANILQAAIGAALHHGLASALENAATGGSTWGGILGSFAVRGGGLWGFSTVFEASLAAVIVSGWLYVYVATNVALAAFNLLPIPPLDGSRLVAVLLKGRMLHFWDGLERYGMLLVFAFLYFPWTHRLLSSAIHVAMAILGFGDAS